MVRGGSLKSLKSSSSYEPSSHKEPLHEKAGFHYILILLVIVSLALSIYASFNVYQLKSLSSQTEIGVDGFLAKLNAHPELRGLENEQPIGGQLDAASLETLKQQFPNVYANAKVGDFLLRYSTKLIIYDYNQDKIINTVNLG